jgi:hypothetical protein
VQQPRQRAAIEPAGIGADRYSSFGPGHERHGYRTTSRSGLENATVAL